MGGFFGRLFGSDKALAGIVGAARDGLDALVYTGEERAQDAMRVREQAAQQVIGWMRATQGQNLSRRLLALSTGAVWLAQIVIAQIVAAVAIFVAGEDSEQLAALVELLRSGAAEMNGIILLIFGFYFGGPHFTKAIGLLNSGGQSKGKDDKAPA